jgi:hypothetical protein
MELKKSGIESGSRFIFTPVHIPNKKAPRKKVAVTKDENEESEKAGKNIHCVVRLKK